jgi:hypothetical protein
MISNPYEEPPMEPGNDQALAWGRGLIFGLTGPLQGGEAPPGDVQDDVLEAFASGQLVGQQASIDGVDVFPQCISTSEEHHIPLSVELGFEGASYLVEAYDAGRLFVAGAAFASGIMVLLDVALSAHHFTPPEEAIDRISRDMMSSLQSLGRADCEFYVGGGVDFDAVGCELQLTRLFRTRDQARSAAVGIGRGIWFVGYWAANQCGTLELVEGSTE